MKNLEHCQMHWSARLHHISYPEFNWSEDYDEMERMWTRAKRVLDRTQKLERLKKKLRVP